MLTASRHLFAIICILMTATGHRMHVRLLQMAQITLLITVSLNPGRPSLRCGLAITRLGKHLIGKPVKREGTTLEPASCCDHGTS
ncbi:hypothetical protein BGY98DRAFT_1007541 [Russula aff. rugulosa BPL654]|nr:hypothetical protein BGY98DRAFT_1007541 [Russula aff. rugulosa BPL654]